jgi:hypothetical protein
VWPWVVVSPDLLGGLETHLVEGFKDIAVEHLLSICSVEAFNEAVLHRPAALDEAPLDGMPSDPLLELVAYEFWAVIYANRRRILSTSRLKSSITLNVRTRRPDQSASGHEISRPDLVRTPAPYADFARTCPCR